MPNVCASDTWKGPMAWTLFSDSNILVRNYLILKNYVKGVVSYQVSCYANNKVEYLRNVSSAFSDIAIG